MFHLALQFLLWDLTAAGVLALLLGLVMVLQTTYRGAAAVLRRGLRSEAVSTVRVVRLSSPRMPEAAASGR